MLGSMMGGMGVSDSPSPIVLERLGCITDTVRTKRLTRMASKTVPISMEATAAASRQPWSSYFSHVLAISAVPYVIECIHGSQVLPRKCPHSEKLLAWREESNACLSTEGRFGDRGPVKASTRLFLVLGCPTCARLDSTTQDARQESRSLSLIFHLERPLDPSAALFVELGGAGSVLRPEQIGARPTYESMNPAVGQE